MREEWSFPNRATPLGSSAYYSVRFAPARLRDDLAALVAWRQQVRAILDEVSDPGVARIKLQWWREELERTHAGAPRHPLSHALMPALRGHRLPTEPFLQMASEVEAGILRRQPRDETSLDKASRRDQGALFELMTRCHGTSVPEVLDTARRLGAFCARVYLIRDSGALARLGRAVFPADLLEGYGLSAEALTQREHRTRLPELLAVAAAEARRSLPTEGQISCLPVAARARAAILGSLLDELERSGFALADQSVRLTPLRKLWLAWREHRRAKSGRRNGDRITHE
jgi:phytoene synthase